MYSNMCVKIALCLALIVSIDGYTLKHRTLPLSPEGMTVEITVRSNEDPRHPLSTMKIDINEKDKKVEMSMAEAPSGVLKHFSNANDGVATLGDRAGVFAVGNCAAEQTFRGNICVPNKASEDYSEINLSEVNNNEPTLENRASTLVGLCAAGYTPRGRFCIPDDY